MGLQLVYFFPGISGGGTLAVCIVNALLLPAQEDHPAKRDDHTGSKLNKESPPESSPREGDITRYVCLLHISSRTSKTPTSF
jgi:hypothetical protein